MTTTISDKIGPNDVALIRGLSSVGDRLDRGQLSSELTGTTLIITDVGGWICEAGVAFNTIRINTKVLQILFAYSYAYCAYYSRVCRGVRPNGQYISIAEDPELTIPRKMLSWATNNLTGIEDTDYSSSPDFPIPKYEPDSEVFQLFLGALSFILRHEAMHLVLGHEPSIEEERLCDTSAAEGLISELEATDRDLAVKGMAIGLTLMNAIGMHTGNYDGLNHPFAYNRLVDCLLPHCDANTDTVWDWVVALFSLHMTENRINQPTKEFDTFYDCVVCYQAILDDHRKKHME